MLSFCPVKPKPERLETAEVARPGERPASTVREAFVGQSLIRPALKALAKSVAAPAAVPASKAYFDAYLAALAKPIAVPALSASRKKRNRLAKNLPAVPKAAFGTANGNEFGECIVCKCKIKLKNLSNHLAKKHPNWTPGTGPGVSITTQAGNPSSAMKGTPVVRPKVQATTRGGLPIVYLPSPRPVPQRDDRVLCPKNCGKKVSPQFMEKHFISYHSSTQETLGHSLATDAFPFELLPPGTKELWSVIERDFKLSRAHSISSYGQARDWDRFRQIELLDPVGRHRGKKSWDGYVVYEFAYTRRVVLECAIEGNAVYILPGDWKEMIHLSKAQIRKEYEGRCTRVKHTGNWIARVRKAL